MRLENGGYSRLLRANRPPARNFVKLTPISVLEVSSSTPTVCLSGRFAPHNGRPDVRSYMAKVTPAPIAKKFRSIKW